MGHCLHNTFLHPSYSFLNTLSKILNSQLLKMIFFSCICMRFCSSCWFASFLTTAFHIYGKNDKNLFKSLFLVYPFCFRDLWLLLLLNSRIAARLSLKQSPRSTGPHSSAPQRLALVALTLTSSHLLYFLSSVGSSKLTLASSMLTNHALRAF